MTADGLRDMWHAVLQGVPKALAFIAILFIGWLLARGVRALVAKLLTKVGFDRAVERGGVGRTLRAAKISAADLCARIAYWAVVLFALQLAFGLWGANPVSDLLNELIAWLPRLFLAIVIIVVAAALAGAAHDLIAAALGGLSYGRLLARAAAFVIVGLGVIAALDEIRIATSVTQPLLIAVLATLAGVVIVGVGGGLIRPMQNRWEGWLDKASTESEAIKNQAIAYAGDRARRAEEERLAEEARRAEEARLAEEARAAEEARVAEEARLAEEARVAEEARRAEAARLAEEARVAEEARRAEEAKRQEEARQADEARRAEEARVAEEAARMAQEARVVEEARQAEAERRAVEARAEVERRSRQPESSIEQTQVISTGRPHLVPGFGDDPADDLDADGATTGDVLKSHADATTDLSAAVRSVRDGDSEATAVIRPGENTVDLLRSRQSTPADTTSDLTGHAQTDDDEDGDRTTIIRPVSGPAASTDDDGDGDRTTVIRPASGPAGGTDADPTSVIRPLSTTDADPTSVIRLGEDTAADEDRTTVITSNDTADTTVINPNDGNTVVIGSGTTPAAADSVPAADRAAADAEREADDPAADAEREADDPAADAEREAADAEREAGEPSGEAAEDPAFAESEPEPVPDDEIEDDRTSGDKPSATVTAPGEDRLITKKPTPAKETPATRPADEPGAGERP